MGESGNGNESMRVGREWEQESHSCTPLIQVSIQFSFQSSNGRNTKKPCLVESPSFRQTDPASPSTFHCRSPCTTLAEQMHAPASITNNKPILINIRSSPPRLNHYWNILTWNNIDGISTFNPTDTPSISLTVWLTHCLSTARCKRLQPTWLLIH